MLHETCKGLCCGSYVPLCVLWMVFQNQVLFTAMSFRVILMCSCFFVRYDRSNSRFTAVLYLCNHGAAHRAQMTYAKSQNIAF